MGVIFQPQPGLPVPVTLYVPAGPATGAAATRPAAGKRPAIIMVPAHHTGRNSHDLLVLGASFARAGGVDGKDIGYWDGLDKYCKSSVYNTTLCTLMLEVYYRYLPTFKVVASAPTAVNTSGKAEDAKDGLIIK